METTYVGRSIMIIPRPWIYFLKNPIFFLFWILMQRKNWLFLNWENGWIEWRTFDWKSSDKTVENKSNGISSSGSNCVICSEILNCNIKSAWSTWQNWPDQNKYNVWRNNVFIFQVVDRGQTDSIRKHAECTIRQKC